MATNSSSRRPPSGNCFRITGSPASSGSRKVLALTAILLGFTAASGCTSKKEPAPVPKLPDPALSTPAATIPSASQPNPTAPNPEKTFTFRLIGDPETLDWNRAHTSVETHLLTNLMEGLVTHDSKMHIVPALAESWEKSPDGKTYVFKLKENLKWSDGVSLRAQDFVYSWKRLLSPVTSASYAYLLFDLENAEEFYKGKVQDFDKVGVKALDDRTLEVKLSKPVAHFIHIPSFWVTYPLRQDIVEKYGSGWPKPGRMVTVGPFVLQSYDIDSKIIMRANPNYHGKRGNLDAAVALIVKEDSTALTLYETGKIDLLTDIATVDLKRLEARPDLRTFDYLKTGYLGLVHGKFPMNNTHFRRAIAMAIDKRKIPEFLHGGQQPTGSFIPEGMFGFNRSIGLPFDPLKAKKELRLAGIEPGSRVKIQLTITNWEKNLMLAQFIQQELNRNLGLKVEIHPFDHKTFRAQLELFSFSSFVLSWSADYPDPDNFMSVFLSESGNNRLQWKNQQYDAKVMLARYNQNPKARQKLYDDAQRILVEEDVALVPLYNESIQALVKDRVKKLEINALNSLNLKNISIQAP